MIHALRTLGSGRTLTSLEAEEVMRTILEGAAQPEQVGAFLATLHFRPPNGSMLAGFVRAFRTGSPDVSLELGGDLDAIDVCGTGGDASSIATFNISTAVAFVAAAAGQPVAKHGNRAVSSQCGSFDVIEALGVPFADTAGEARESLRQHGLAFMYAPSFHPAMRRLVPIRKLLGTRTVFNVLGPLLNPARVRMQLIGVYAESLVVPVAEALQELGAKHVMVVHGLDGSDELSLCAPSKVAHVQEGRVRVFELSPEELGLKRAAKESLSGGDPQVNASILRTLFENEVGPRQDVVALNAAAAFLVGGKVLSLPDGLELARQTLRNGRAAALLREMQNGFGRVESGRTGAPGAAS